MLNTITAVGYGLVLFLCLFAIIIIYFLFRGGVREANRAERNIGTRVLDRTAWGMNGIACLWMVLRHRHRLYKYIELTFANDPRPGLRNFSSTGEVVGLLEGMVVTSYVFPEHPDGRALFVRRPFEFLGNDWLESMGVRPRDGRVT
jgi:hypothetical protein